jgi:hypothetical protein
MNMGLLMDGHGQMCLRTPWRRLWWLSSIVWTAL